MFKVWSDAPITSVNEDDFGRGAYARQVAQLIQGTHSWEHSTVFGLTGPWGSGKSSMLAMIEEELQRDQVERKTHEDRWHIAHFTPWATSDVNGLMGDFYASLSSALPSGEAKKLREKLGVILQISSPAAKLIPLFGGSVEKATKKAGEALQKQPSWNEAFQEASEELKNLKTPILVIADDIDRLHSQELLALLKVVRLLGRFPGVHFLLAYDEQTVTETLAQTGISGTEKTSSRKFMEKIVQYPLAIPPLLTTQLLARLNKGLEPFLDSMEKPEFFGMRLQALRKVLFSQLSTPRAIDRYLAQVRHHLAMFDPKEILVEDVIILTLLKTSFPSLYNELPRYKDQLISGTARGYSSGYRNSAEDMFDLAPLLERFAPKDRNDASIILEALFPKLSRSGGSYHFSMNPSRTLYDQRYFDRYFAMGIPAYDISNTEVADAVSLAVSENATELKNLLLDKNHERVQLVIDKAEISTDLFEKDSERLAIVHAVAPILSEIETPDHSLLSVERRMMEWVAKILSDISDQATSNSIDSVLSEIPGILNQAQIIRFMLIFNSKHHWTDEVLEKICRRIVGILFENIQRRDSAPQNTEAEFMIFLLREWGGLDALKEKLSDKLQENNFTIEDIAARFVSCVNVSKGTGMQMQLHDFNNEAFNQVIPNAGTTWYSDPKEGINEYDLSWENRKLFAIFKAAEAKNLDN